MAPHEKIKVRTTLPYPIAPGLTREELHTPRLLMRAPRPSDLDEYHALRSQPEVMAFTSAGRVDRDLDESRAKLDKFLPPQEELNYNFVILDRETGALIGVGGVHGASELGWPEVGYMIRREAWGKGYMTEFVKAWIESWWKLPRYEIELEVDPASVDVPAGGGIATVPEQLAAVVEKSHRPSRNILEKCGFRPYKEWIEHDNRPGKEGIENSLMAYGLIAPK